MFPEDWKNPKNSAIIDNIWRQYKSGQRGLDDTRQKILDVAGGIKRPSWDRPAVSPYGAARNSGYAPELFEPRIYGTAAPPSFSGTGRGTSAPGPLRERNVSYELDFGAGAPYNEQFPEWSDLSGNEKARIATAILPKITDFAKQLSGANEYARVYGLGGWHEFTNPAYKSRLVATPEQAGDFADAIGYLAQQTEIFGYHKNPSGDHIGLALHGEGFADPAKVDAFWKDFAAQHPDLAAGFSPSKDGLGRPGIEIIFENSGKDVDDRIKKDIIPKLQRIADDHALGKIEATPFKATTESRSHDWTKDPSGSDYLERLAQRHGPDLPARLDLFRRQELEPELARQIATGRRIERGRGLQEAQGSPALPLAAVAKPVTLGSGITADDPRYLRALATAQEAAGRRPWIVGLPRENISLGTEPFIPGPVGYLHDIADNYMRDAKLPYNPPKMFAKLDRDRAQRIAKAFDDMKHAPDDPAVKASYEAMAKETIAQYKALKNSGVKFDFIPDGASDPYAGNPRLAAKDVIENKHLWVFPTESGFGSGTESSLAAMKNNPLLAPTDEYISGHRATVNDLFRVVHDMFGHVKDGFGFRSEGEENAWRSHSAMYSDLARPAMTSETRGQNSWVNWGPHGEKNRKASAADTVYADQKIGLLPDWAVNEGRHDPVDFERVEGNPFVLGSGQTGENNAPRWFSAVENAIANSKTNSAPAGQWLGMLKNAPGVKQEEIDWLGLDDWLKEQKGPVSRQQLSDYVNGHRVNLQETVRGEDMDADEARHRINNGDRVFDAFHRGVFEPKDGETYYASENDPKYTQYRLPGGDNYREMLLTLPERTLTEDEALPIAKEMAKKNFIDLDAAGPHTRQSYLDAARRPVERAFMSSHWTEPNVLAHVRFDDRNIDNDKSLHMAEVQSDWHKTGQLKGYDVSALSPSEVAHLRARSDEIEHLFPKGRRENFSEYINRMPDEMRAEYLRVNRALDRNTYGVPDAPFKKTWPELALKRMIRKAAEDGYDRISWDTGATNADRYDLGHHVDSVSWSPESNRLLARKDGKFIVDQETPKEKLADYVGKDVADKLINNPTNRTNVEPEHTLEFNKDAKKWNILSGAGGVVKSFHDKDAAQATLDALNSSKTFHHVSGPDLRVGGEGMRGFYDKILPSIANKIGKKYGAKVEQAQMPLAGPERWLVETPEGQRIPLNSEEEAVALATEGRRGQVIHSRKAGPVWSLKITPELRRAALQQGFPMFARGGAVKRASGGRVEPKNIDHEPTDAQKAAGNYSKDRLHKFGLKLTIENAKGSIRRGVGKGGKSWESRLPAHYGYLRGQRDGRDGDPIDVYLGPHGASPHVFVVDQVDADTKRFDEHKTMLGFGSKAQALNVYKAAFSDGRGAARIGKCHVVTLDQFKDWLNHGDMKKPFALFEAEPEVVLPKGFTLEYADRFGFGIYDPDGVQVATGKTRREVAANFAKKNTNKNNVFAKKAA